MNRIHWRKGVPIFLLSKGGLGNQLFVYAYAHELNLETNRRVVVSTYWHKMNSDRKFQLADFSKLCKHQTNFNHSRSLYAILFLVSKIQAKSGRKLNRLFGMFGIFHEPNLPTNKSSMKKSLFIEGYFQDQIIYRHIQEFVTEIQKYVDEFEITLPGRFSAGHLRRGDYNAEVENFGLLHRDYYEDLVKDLDRVVICTDDYQLASDYWCNKSNVIIYGPDQLTPWEVISVLSKSSKLFIANSSLSWWAGMIQMSKGGITYIPQPWFRIYRQDDSRMTAKGMIVKPAIWTDR